MATGQLVVAQAPAGQPGAAVNESVTARPAAGLRPLIAGYSGYRQAGLAPAVHRGMPSPYLTLIFTLNELLRTGGRSGIAALAGQTGWSDRHLRGRFRAQIGLSPKEAARVIRFDRSRRLLGRRIRGGRPPGLAELAAAGGYYDQAHLDREFRALGGCSPTAWLMEEFRNVQDGADDWLTGSGHG
jgi:AraC-like DNA-binding protein